MTYFGRTALESLKQRLNEETNQILQKCLKEVETLLKKEIELLDRFAKELLEKEELEYDAIEAIFVDLEKLLLNKKLTGFFIVSLFCLVYVPGVAYIS